MASKDGFIYLYKKALDLEYGSALFGFFTRTLLLANHSKGKEPGVVNISTRDLSRVTHLSRPTVMAYLKRLQDDQTIKILSTSTQRMRFRFINYLEYQTKRQTGKKEIPVEGGKLVPEIDQSGQKEIPVGKKHWSKGDTKLVPEIDQSGQKEIPVWSKGDTSAKAKLKLGSKLSKLSKSNKGRLKPSDPNVKKALDIISQKLGYQIPHYPREGKEVKRAFQMDFTLEQFIACWEKMKSFSFWQGKWLPLAKVTDNLGEFVAGRLKDFKERTKLSTTEEMERSL